MKWQSAFCALVVALYSYGVVPKDAPFKSLKPFCDIENGAQFKGKGDWNSYAGVVFPDWDNDGDYDMIKVEYGVDKITYHENKGNATKHDFRESEQLFKMAHNGNPISIAKEG